MMRRPLVWLMICMAGWVYWDGAASSTYAQRPISPPDSLRIDPRFRVIVAQAASDVPLKVWVFFNDKGISDDRALRRAIQDGERTLIARALQRRQRRRTGSLTDFYDLPVFEPYVRQIMASGGRVNAASRWLNAVSVTATPDVVRRLTRLPFVRTIAPVAVHRRPLPPVPADDPPSKPVTPSTGNGLSYGPSSTQLARIHVPELHERGLSGRGVLIAMLDTGYDLSHVAFDSLRTRVVAERDFIYGDEHSADDPAQDFPGQHNHGTETLSTIGGYAPGNLIGPAYGAYFLLAKTETVSFEQQIEEDWWVQAIEWADSLGADVVSSSLGYNLWYQYSDMDGQTAVTTRAATIAAGRGIVVVNAMGNEGQTSWQKMIAPADADGILSVGAVDSTGIRAPFSSKGPTFDGRIKPDVAAMGVAVRVVNPGNTTSYLRVDGTSFSTPLTAGVVALLLEETPDWTPAQVIQALRSTASRAAAPDTLLGYGIVNALAALPQQHPVPPPESFSLKQNFPNPFNPKTSISFDVPALTHITLTVYNVLGQQVRVLVDDIRSPGQYKEIWDGRDGSGRLLASGIYLYRLSSGTFISSRKMTLIR